MDKLNPGPQVSHIGRTAIKTLAIHMTDQIPFSYNTPTTITQPQSYLSTNQTSHSQTSENHCPETIQEQITNQSVLPLHANTLGGHCCVIDNSMPCSTVCYIAALLQMAAPEKKQGPCYIHQSMQFNYSRLWYTVILSPTTLYDHGASRSNACYT